MVTSLGVDARTLTLMLAISLCGCAGQVFPPPAPGRVIALGPIGSTAAAPETPEARAQEVVDRIAAYCAEYGEECVAYFQPDIYPNVEVPATVRYFVTSREQEVRSLGFEVRWDPGTSRFEIERGNTLTYNFNQDPPS